MRDHHDAGERTRDGERVDAGQRASGGADVASAGLSGHFRLSVARHAPVTEGVSKD